MNLAQRGCFNALGSLAHTLSMPSHVCKPPLRACAVVKLNTAALADTALSSPSTLRICRKLDAASYQSDCDTQLVCLAWASVGSFCGPTGPVQHTAKDLTEHASL